MAHSAYPRLDYPTENKLLVSCDLFGDGIAMTLTQWFDSDSVTVRPAAGDQRDTLEEDRAWSLMFTTPQETSWTVVSVSCDGETFLATESIKIWAENPICESVLAAVNKSERVGELIGSYCPSAPEKILTASSEFVVADDQYKCIVQSSLGNELEILLWPDQITAFCGRDAPRNRVWNRHGLFKSIPQSVASGEAVSQPFTEMLSSFSFSVRAILPDPFRSMKDAPLWCENLRALNPDSVCQHAQINKLEITSESGTCTISRTVGTSVLSLSVNRVDDWKVVELRCGKEGEPIPVSERSAETQRQLLEIASRFELNFDRLERTSWGGCAALLPEHFSGVSFENLCSLKLRV